MKFDFNEYVWDRVWDGPAIVLRVSPKAVRPYIVGEITRANKSLNRMACRNEKELCRYVNIKLPEDEALVLLRDGNGSILEEYGATDSEYDALSAACARIVEQLELRGVPVEP